MDETPRPSRRDTFTELDDGWTLTSELLSAVLVWTGIGWLGDRWLGTEPWLLVVGAVLGFALGMYIAWLRLQPDRTDTPTD